MKFWQKIQKRIAVLSCAAMIAGSGIAAAQVVTVDGYGDDKESAILSLKDLQSIKKTKPKDTLYVEGMGGKKTSIYFDGMGQMIFDTDGVAGFSYQLGFLKFDKAISAIEKFEE